MTDAAEKKTPANGRPGLPEGDPRHGTKNGYVNYGCRCGRCRVAFTNPAFSIEKVGPGYEVWIGSEQAWFTVGDRVA